jgi:hypothetical protein
MLIIITIFILRIESIETEWLIGKEIEKKGSKFHR